MTDPHFSSSADICDATVDRAMASFQQAVNSMVACKRCNGTGYHHGFGEHGHDPDWCEVCGGCQSVPEFDDREAMRQAIKAAQSGAPAQAVSESIPRASHTARQGGWRLDFDWLVRMQGEIEEATGYNITLECLEEAVVRTEAICTAAQPPAAPVETERKTFTIPPGYEAVRDSEGRATGEVRPQSSADSGDKRNQAERLLNDAMDHIAGTLEQPGDIRTWDHLLIYCPREAIERRSQKLNQGERHDAFLAPVRPADEIQRRLSIRGGSEPGGENTLEHEPNRNAQVGMEVPAGGIPQVKIAGALNQLRLAEESTADEVTRRHLREIISWLDDASTLSRPEQS